MLPVSAKALLTIDLSNIFKTQVRHYFPRRAYMYVPGDDLKKINKAIAIDVDSVALDCEDGIAINHKTQARNTIRSVLDKGLPLKKRKYDFGVRINSTTSEFFNEDIAVIFSGKHLPDTVTLPKVDEPSEIKLFAELLNKQIKSNAKVNLILGIESARAFIDLKNIIKTAEDLSTGSKFVLSAVLFGSDDFCASIGATRTEAGLEVLYARQKLVLNAKAFNLQAIDMVYIKYKDLEGLKKQAIEGATLGFTGKQVIHPDQVPVVQEAFLPTKQQIEWATGLLKAFHSHQQHGEGAFTYQGNMIDMPTMRQAQNIMDLINAVMVQS